MKKSFPVLIPLLLSLLLITDGSTLAENPPPTPPPPYQPIREKRPLPPGIPTVDENGLWHVDQSLSGPGSQVITPLAVGGPDEYGYTWDDSEPFAWIDATTGTDTGMSGYKQAVSVPLPFTFKYYENEYDNVWITSSGYLSFTSASNWVTYSEIPSPGSPNNVIAGYWTPIELADSGPSGRAYYSSGGVSPNRYFIVEWYQATYSDEHI